MTNTQPTHTPKKENPKYNLNTNTPCIKPNPALKPNKVKLSPEILLHWARCSCRIPSRVTQPRPNRPSIAP
ncbi:hypothetical protein BDV37DRAFT_246935 [Aspergillus pseudonomiae]|uniref:Uncharacterized protein n=1 Tax=Aspergillus pseudonomiae TaxID=1506151 RepID=A0A5N7DET9_9EURO|nr:uncharacterized protein BDV37DRAFT_246935 [Aspergillus pseudonomiae]KAE8404774.1 hypothetical protein BDV37DRAFT_246935 [Aspergillus pseudonomiae]